MFLQYRTRRPLSPILQLYAVCLLSGERDGAGRAWFPDPGFGVGMYMCKDESEAWEAQMV